jgi:hypothetical protein
VRMPLDELKSLDVWIRDATSLRQRGRAIRQLVGQALPGGAQPSEKRSNQRQGARDGRTGVDRLLGDARSLTADEQERRKRRLTRG